MAETAAHLVDRVIPDVPVRQWAPPMNRERLSLAPDGRVVLELRRAFRDGTTHLLFDPLTFLERLAALVVAAEPLELITLVGGDAHVRRELRAYLRCGILAYGFARVRRDRRTRRRAPARESGGSN